MAMEWQATGNGTIKALEGWGWAQLSTDTTTVAAYLNADLPALTAFGNVTDNLHPFPEFSLDATGTENDVQGGTFEVPEFSTTGYGGGSQIGATLTLSATIAGTSLELGRTGVLNTPTGYLTIPDFGLTASGITMQYGDANPRIPQFTLQGYGAGNASLDFPPFSVDTLGITQESGSLLDEFACDFIEIFPCGMWSVTGIGTANASGQLDAVMPAFSVTTNVPATLEIPHFWIEAEAA